jgi:inorganic pyrophosphatase
MNPDTPFWQGMTQLLITNSLVIDRRKGTTHPRYPQLIYPLDYGYLENTTSSDGGGIDVWLGSLSTVMDKKTLTGILCTFDTLKRDAEIKLLIACTEEDIQVIRDFHKDMHTLYIPNPVVEHDLSN